MQKKYAIALTAALGLFMGVLDDTVVNVALSNMWAAFHTDLNTIQWVSTAYLLVQAAVIPAAGYFGSRFGIKRLFLICLALFTVGSLLCGLSDLVRDANDQPYIGLLIAARVIQGIGAGVLFPLASTIALSSFAADERAKATGIVAGPVLFGLSMDYHLFILTRIKELKDGGMSSVESVTKGISQTSDTITSAAAIMVAVFLVFVAIPLMMIRQVGFGLAVAVFIDAAIIRSILLPATMHLLGDWNWYIPRWLDWLPRITIEAEPEAAVPQPSTSETEVGKLV